MTDLEPRSIQLMASVEEAGGMFIGPNGRPVGVSLPQGLPFERYAALLHMFWDVHNLSRWCIGDILAAAEPEYRHDIYAQAISLTQLSQNTLENYASTSRLVPPQRRRENVGHSIHVEVKGLPAGSQKRLLAKAEREQLTKEAVRELVREEKGHPPEPIEREICESCGRPI